MDEPLISVAFTLRGGVAGIRTALASLQAQTHENWEAIAVDGGLPPHIRESVAGLARAESRLRLVDDSSATDIAAARDAAVRRSRGEWIAFLDSNERFLAHSLAVRLETGHSDALSVIHSDGYETTADEPATIGVPPLAGWVYRDLLQQQGPLFPGLLIRRRAIAECGSLDRRLQRFQEWDLSIRLAQNHQFGFEPVPTFVSAPHPAIPDAALDAAGAEDYERVLRKHRLRMLRRGGAGWLAQHYRAVAESYEQAGLERAAARCRRAAFLCKWGDRARVLGNARRLWSRQARVPPHVRFAQRSHLDSADVSLRLSELLRVPVRGLTSEFSAGQSGHVHCVHFRDASEVRRTVVLKKVDTAFEFEFYTQVLEPLALDAPKTHGYVETSTGRFLVMDYVTHEPARWTDYEKFRMATRWLAKKDMVVHEHFQRILDTRLLHFRPDHPPLIDTIEDSIEILRKGVERDVSPLLSPLFLRSVVRRRRVLHRLAAAVFGKSRLTVCHRDFHLRNVLFPPHDATAIHVIDWSNPQIDSVCVDLARLVLLSPPPIRRELIDIYRAIVDFDGFEERYRETESIMMLAQFAWSLSVILEGRRQPHNTAELRKARTLQRRLVERLRLGLD